MTETNTDRQVFPAPAGVILCPTEVAPLTTSFPRTCGGDPGVDVALAVADGFSPHLRG